METPFADSTNTQSRAEDAIQLSSAIAAQILDKQTIGDKAQQHFADWDKSRDGALSLLELSDIYDSPDVSYEERATASILAQNYYRFNSLSANHLEGVPPSAFTDAGYQHLKSLFGSDKVESDITQKDLAAFSMLTSVGGEQKFIEEAQTAEKNSLAMNGIHTGFNATLAGIFGAKIMFAPGPLRLLTLAAFAVSTYGTIAKGQATLDAVGTNDMQEMEKQFQRRKAMLDNLEVPRL